MIILLWRKKYEKIVYYKNIYKSFNTTLIVSVVDFYDLMAYLWLVQRFHDGRIPLALKSHKHIIIINMSLQFVTLHLIVKTLFTKFINYDIMHNMMYNL